MGMKFGGLRFALVAGLGVLASFAPPAWAGDDEECLSTTVEGWGVWYDDLCAKEILRRFDVDGGSIGISFAFPSDSSQGPARLSLYNPASYAGVEEPASSAEIFVNGRSLERTAGVYLAGFSPATTKAVFDALRQKKSVTLTVNFDMGAKTFPITHVGFDAAYQMLL